MEDPGPRSPAPPPPSGGAPYGASEVTAENRLAVTEAPRDRQDKISGATAALVVAGEEPGARASSGKSLQQQGPPGTGAYSNKCVQQQGPPGTRASSGMDSTRHGVGFNTASRIRTALAREALVNETMKNCKGEQLNGADKRLKMDAYQQLMDLDSKANWPEFRHKHVTGISNSTKTIVGGTLGFL